MLNQTNKLFLVGAGGHAKQVADIFIDNGYKISGAFDDCKKGFFYNNIPILGNISEITKISGNFFCTIGDNIYRNKIIDTYSHSGINWLNCISKLSYISSTATIGVGNYVGIHTIIQSDTKIGNFNIINDAVTIAHDNRLGDLNHIAPNVSIGGRTTIGNNNLIGTNSTINPDIIINDNITVGSGAVVIRNLIDAGIYVGVPCRRLIYNII